jgi:hypothetical protein
MGLRQLTANEVPDWGGWQQAAKWIEEIRGIEISRQRVYSLHYWRNGNGFPAAAAVRLPDGSVKNNWFYKADIIQWSMTHRFRNSGSRQGKLAS